jgi:hypothetical protein
MVKICISLSSAWCLATTQPSEQKTQNPFPTFTLFPLQLNQTICFPSSYFLEFPLSPMFSAYLYQKRGGIPPVINTVFLNVTMYPFFLFFYCFLILFLLSSVLEWDFELFIDNCLDENKGCICC